MKINPKLRRICLYPRTGSGGPATFQANLARGLAALGIEVTYNTEDLPFGALLVTGGSRHLAAIRRVRKAGIPVVQRLNGMNWIHRRRSTGIRHFLRAEYGNLILRTLRNRLADHVIYQSQFTREWWERVEGPTPVSTSVVYNGVDLEMFSNVGVEERPKDCWRVLLVEGNLMGGYEVGLEHAIEFARQLDNLTTLPIELMIVGQVPAKIEARYRSKSGV